MFMSGVVIGMVRHTTAHRPGPIPLARRRVATVFCVAVAGSTTRASVV